MLSGAQHKCEIFGEGQNTVLDMAGANQTKCIIRKKVQCVVIKTSVPCTAKPTS